MTVAGAEAFTSYFFERVNASYLEAKPEYFDTLVVASCKSCAGFREAVSGLKAAGHHYDGPFATITNITIATSNANDAKTFVSTQTPVCNVVDSAGNKIESILADNTSLSVFLTFSGQWHVTAIKAAT